MLLKQKWQLSQTCAGVFWSVECFKYLQSGSLPYPVILHHVSFARLLYSLCNHYFNFFSSFKFLNLVVLIRTKDAVYNLRISSCYLIFILNKFKLCTGVKYFPFPCKVTYNQNEDQWDEDLNQICQQKEKSWNKFPM